MTIPREGIMIMGERVTQYSDISGDVAVVEDDETVDDVRTHTWEIDGERIEFESLDSEHNGLKAAVEAYLGEGFSKARKATGRPATATSGRSRGASSAPRDGAGELSRAESKACRQWAREQGYEVSDRGSMPKDARAAWEKAGRPQPRNEPPVTARSDDAGEPDDDGQHDQQDQHDEAADDEAAPEPALAGA